MPYKLNPQELQAVVNLPADRRYEYFIKRIVDWEQVWGLANEDGWVVASDGTTASIPFWPHPTFASLCAADGWDSTSPEQLTLDELLELLEDLVRDGLHVAVFPTATGKGTTVAPQAVIRSIETEQEKYG